MRLLAIVAVISLVAAQPLLAQGAEQTRYRWVDDQGHKHLSDEVPADAARFGYDVLNSYGRVIRHVDGAKTPEELAAAKAQAKIAQEAREQRRADEQLLVTYPTEKDLVQSQQTQLDMTEQRIESTRINMKSQLESLAGLLDQAGQQQQQGKPVPPYLQQQIDKQREVIRGQREWIDKTTTELETTRKEAADTLKRYRAVHKSLHPDSPVSSSSAETP